MSSESCLNSQELASRLEKASSVQLRPGTLHFLVIFTCRFWNSSRANENTGELSLDTYV